MDEADLKAKLGGTFADMLPEVMFGRHEDRYKAGWPDITATGGGFTTWIEVKHANPGIRHRRIQDVRCVQLANAGRCIYVIYHYEKFEGQRLHLTTICRPLSVYNRTWKHDFLRRCVGPSTHQHDHTVVVDFIRESHGL